MHAGSISPEDISANYSDAESVGADRPRRVHSGEDESQL